MPEFKESKDYGLGQPFKSFMNSKHGLSGLKLSDIQESFDHPKKNAPIAPAAEESLKHLSNDICNTNTMELLRSNQSKMESIQQNIHQFDKQYKKDYKWIHEKMNTLDSLSSKVNGHEASIKTTHSIAISAKASNHFTSKDVETLKVRVDLISEEMDCISKDHGKQSECIRQVAESSKRKLDEIDSLVSDMNSKWNDMEEQLKDLQETVSEVQEQTQMHSRNESKRRRSEILASATIGATVSLVGVAAMLFGPEWSG